MEDDKDGKICRGPSSIKVTVVGGRHKNVIDRPRAKTTDAGEFPAWGKGHGDICGDHMTSVFDEKVDFGVTF